MPGLRLMTNPELCLRLEETPSFGNPVRYLIGGPGESFPGWEFEGIAPLQALCPQSGPAMRGVSDSFMNPHTGSA